MGPALSLTARCRRASTSQCQPFSQRFDVSRAWSSSISLSNRQPSNPIARVFDENQRTRFQSSRTLSEYQAETLIDRPRRLIVQPENDHARLVEHAQGQHVTKIEIEREHDAGIGASTCDDLDVRCAFQTERSNVHSLMAKCDQEINGDRREPRVGEEPHRLCTKVVQFVLSESRRVDKRLPDVLLVEVLQVGDDLGWRHAVGYEVDDVGHGDAKAPNSGSPSQDVRNVRDAIQWLCHADL